MIVPPPEATDRMKPTPQETAGPITSPAALENSSPGGFRPNCSQPPNFCTQRETFSPMICCRRAA